MKKAFSCMIFCLLTLLLIGRISDILVPKATNRYYILEKYLEYNPKDFDVHIYGSCHSYTSFNPIFLEKQTGVESFIYGNAGEIIPTTYVRMYEQFKEYAPKIAFVEIWGINPYETYDTTEKILGYYLPVNLERLPISLEKLEVIQDYENWVDMLEMNFPIASYKDRIMDEALLDIDFDYSFEGTKPHSSNYNNSEMTSRLAYNGFKLNPSKEILDYPIYQNHIDSDEFLEIEPDIVKYLEKIIILCKKHDVELIFYRSPYISTENELRKLNHLRQICAEHNVKFIDLEEVIQYDYAVDFLDYQHLSETGANKSTEYLITYILDAINLDK
ncbi:MAG: hypothetical protein IKT52_02650 [Oscillospiraceae bacterium]|nr:hypothetical protein [Oscillospiraceae bacterium]